MVRCVGRLWYVKKIIIKLVENSGADPYPF
jgi:hypothetical protein